MADIQPLNNSISDDDELASVLAGVKNEAATLEPPQPAAVPDVPTVASFPSIPPVMPPTPTFDFEETPSKAPGVDVTPFAAAQAMPTAPAISSAPAAAYTSAPSITTPVAANPELESLKKETLNELRPLVGKLDLPAEEKFDTQLLIIRSTDDQTLLTAAHDAAKSIADEARRAGALLDIIKEIDYFSTKA